MPKSLLFYCPRMEALAHRIVGQDLDIALGDIRWNAFEDGWPNILIQKENGIRRMNVAFLAFFETPGDVFTQLSVAYTMSRCGAQDFKIILPYYPTGTLERGDNEGHVVTAKTLARMISTTPLCRSGPVELVLYDIHTLAQRNYFGDNLVTRYKTGTKYLKKRLEEMPDVAIAFPDYGAYKRFRFAFDGGEARMKDEARRLIKEGHRACDPECTDLLSQIGRVDRQFPMVVCEKVRDGDRRHVHVREGDPEGRHVVIVDDIIRSGNTILECADALREAGAAKVSAYATHGVFPEESWRKFIDAGFEKVWITDSVPTIAETVDGQGPFEVISLAASIARVLAEVQQ